MELIKIKLYIDVISYLQKMKYLLNTNYNHKLDKIKYIYITVYISSTREGIRLVW